MAEVNGTAGGSEPPNFDTANILQALEIIHNSQTKNEVRRQASDYLERLKTSQHALEQGYLLGRDQNQQPLIRHLGLSVLEHVIRHEAHRYSNEQNERLRKCVIELGQNVRQNDQAFIRNKIAELWIELAKRTWALDWYNLDEYLVQLWSVGDAQKDFVLTVLENLSEDTFVREDTTAVLRGRELNGALVEIFTSANNYAGGIKVGDVTYHMRHGTEGWLVRITQYLETYLRHESESLNQKSTALKALATLRSAFGWIMSPAVVHARSLLVTCNCLTQPDPDMIIAALDALITLYGRQKLEEIEIQALVYPLCQAESIAILQQVYSWSVVGVDEIDSQKYTISKKLSELVALLSESLIRFAPPPAHVLNATSFLHFLIAIAEHQSLIVSVPAIHSWVKLLEISSWRKCSQVGDCVAPLLNVVSPRLIQYDQLPEDANEPTIIFVNEEIEIFPERQGFYYNYRKLCSAVIEWICYSHLEQAMEFILIQVDKTLDSIEQAQVSLDLTKYERVSVNILKADAQFSIVDSAFRGLDRWQATHKDPATPELEQMSQRVRHKAKTWASDMLSKRNFSDPQIKQRQIRSAVEISSRALQSDTAFAFSVLEHILSSFIPLRQDHSVYSEAVAELHNYSTSELRRLALQHVDYFVTFYDQLQSKFSDIISRITVEPRVQVDLKSILFLIVQRASTIASSQRQARLWEFLEPISSAWNNSRTQNILSSFDSFVKSQAFDRIGPFMQSVNAVTIEDWSNIQTPQDGAALQQDMTDGYASLPLRETRVMLSISTEKLEQDSETHKIICDLWSSMVPTIVNGVLRLTTYNHQLHITSSWPNVPDEYRQVIQRILRDRYWQSGISGGSMNEFHMQVKSSKASLEGFASSVRGRIRSNLEQCYSIIHTLGRLGSSFYGLPQVPDMIAEALLRSTGPLSPHHFSVILLMLPKLIEECPPGQRQHFLTPILSVLLQQMDTKLTSEWQKLDQKKQTKHEEENLSDEMRDDSVLRQTTYKAVNMIAFWLNPRREEMLQSKKQIVNGDYLVQSESQTMQDFILSNIQILEPLLLFCTHSLVYKDTKACQTMISAAQRIVPAYTSSHYLPESEAASVREYISTDMLKAAIISLHDGYFADYQQYFAQLIAQIWLLYGLPTHVPATETTPAHTREPLTSTPRTVLLSLPGMTAGKIDAAAERIIQEGMNGKSKRLRAILLSLLEGVRGVRMSELGKIDTRQQQNRILEKYKLREEQSMRGIEDISAGRGDEDGGVDLGGVADMFGNA